MSDFWSAAIGTLLGFTAGVATEWWKSGREDLRDLCKGFCEVVAEAADAGAEFWLTPARDDEAPFLFAKVVGYQNRLAGYAAILDGRLDPDMFDEIEGRLAELFKQMTGGNFDDPTRQPSPEFAFGVHSAAGDTIVAIRRASYSRMSFRQRVIRWCARSWVNQTRTMKLPPEKPFPGG